MVDVNNVNSKWCCFWPFLEQATDPSLASENWQLNMEICDMINMSEDGAGAKDAVRAIHKRLKQSKNYTVIMYTLTVLETCVKVWETGHIKILNNNYLLCIERD